jgi:uncharacterized protein YlbG (UPF0298 family)
LVNIAKANFYTDYHFLSYVLKFLGLYCEGVQRHSQSLVSAQSVKHVAISSKFGLPSGNTKFNSKNQK